MLSGEAEGRALKEIVHERWTQWAIAKEDERLEFFEDSFQTFVVLLLPLGSHTHSVGISEESFKRWRKISMMALI